MTAPDVRMENTLAAPSFRTIRWERKQGVGRLILNRPEVRNAFNRAMIDEIRVALTLIDKDEDIRALIVTGAGPFFQVGADIEELRAMTPLEILRVNQDIDSMNAALEGLRPPTIAAVNGHAMGSGMELAVSCSLRVMDESAIMGLPEVKLGIMPGGAGTQRLPRLIGKGRAAELILTGDAVTAEKALSMGLVNRVAREGEAVAVAEELARRIAENAPIAVEMAKDALEVGKDLPVEYAVRYSQKNCLVCFNTEDMKEGMAAFLEKRKADFKRR